MKLPSLLFAVCCLGTSVVNAAPVTASFDSFAAAGPNTSLVFTRSIVDVDYSFDFQLTISGVNIITRLGDIGVGVTSDAAGDIDGLGEDFDVSVEIVNFVDSSLAGVILSDLTFNDVVVTAGNSPNDSGSFTLGSNVFTWQDGNGGSDFVGHDGGNAVFDLNAANGGGVSTFSHAYVDGAYRFESFDVSVNAVTAVPEPTSLLSLALSACCCVVFNCKRRTQESLFRTS